MSGKFDKRLAQLEKLLRDIEAREHEVNGPTAPIRWGGGVLGMMDLFLVSHNRFTKTEDNDLRLKLLIVMRLALAFFFRHLKEDPNCRQLLKLNPQKVLEFVGLANRYAPKFKEFAEFYKTHGFTDGKPDKAKLKELGCPILV